MSKIEWTDKTWNVTTGCTRVSDGCDNCYAVQMSKRLANIDHTKDKYSGLVNEGKDHFNGNVKLHPEALEDAFDIPDGKKVFVNSMSDLFHPDVPFEFIDKVFAVMALNTKNIFQILTKRPERMAEYLIGRKHTSTKVKVMTQLDALAYEHEEYSERAAKIASNIPLQEYLTFNNVWLGTSCENQEAADERIPHLLKCPAAVRFLSCEPLLGEVDLQALKSTKFDHPDVFSQPVFYSALEEGVIAKNKIHWVIAGGESGSNARPCHPDWVRTLRDQCQEANVPFFFKQWGKWKPTDYDDKEYFGKAYSGYLSPDGGELPDGKNGEVLGPKKLEERGCAHITKVGKKESGRELDGKEWNQFPN